MVTLRPRGAWFFDDCDGAQEKDPKKTIMSNEGRGLYRLVNNRIAVKKVQSQNSFFTENFDGVTAPGPCLFFHRLSGSLSVGEISWLSRCEKRSFRLNFPVRNLERATRFEPGLERVRLMQRVYNH